MKKTTTKILAMLLAVIMLVGAFAACGGNTPEQTTEKPSENTTEKVNGNTTEDKGNQTEEPSSSNTTEKPSENTTEKVTEETSEAVTDTPIIEGPKFESPYADTIIAANKLANGIQEYYSGVTQWFSNNGQTLYVENQNMNLSLIRDKKKDQLIGYIQNKDGGVYIENTMDAYIKMSDGKTYYISNTTNDAYTNVTKHGMYYHEIRNERLNFATEDGIRVETLQVARTFHAYSNKLHQELQVCSTKGTRGINAIGFITEVSADKVAKLQVKDANGTHDTLEGVDWATAEYVGFDIIDAGIFGYILPVHVNAGTLSVVLENGKYVITQEACPKDGKIAPGNAEVLNGNDFFMGQRLYTDTTHEFTDLEREAYIERNPLTAKNLKLSTVNSDSAVFSGYDPLRGTYVIDMSYLTSELWNKRQNLHFEANFSIKGDDYDRDIYMLVAHNGGSLECAVVLDENLMSLPIPVQVGKNFSSDGDDVNKNISKDGNVGEHNLFNYADKQYAEALFPLVVKAGDLKEYSVIHMYQNWGNFPLKQISYIHFYVAYYHFSTGLTETNCICYNATNVDMLPDHRAMSAPYWSEGVQHTSGGWHGFFQYKYSPSDSNKGLKNTYKYINSYGPTYCEVDMMFESTDGNIKATYTHMEMPQTDENRAYYTMTYEFTEDTSFKAFKETSRLYFVRSRDGLGKYTQLGYLNENNESVVVDLAPENSDAIYHKLGSEYPYFDLFNMPEWNGMGYVNVAFIVRDYEVIVGGETQDVDLLLKEDDNAVSLTLDLDNVKFKKGDTITIRAIILPWGSQESDYSGTVYAPDQNVRDVRENTLINPIKIEAGENTTLIEDIFVPKVHSENGSSAEFTISGGKVNQHEIKNRDKGYNITVRAYGFTKLTAPKVYEKINGEWVEYELSSKSTPDTLGYTNQYDGYGVHYDEDGTISYSFVIDMSEAKDRTFKIETDYEFKGFARVETEEIVLYPYKFVLEASQVAAVSKKHPMFSSSKSGIEGSMSYVSLHGTDNPSTHESWLNINQTELRKTETGQYIIIKYRLPESNPNKLDVLDIYASTETSAASGPELFRIRSAVETDGKWHVMVVDTKASGFAGTGNSHVLPHEKDGKYHLNFLRIDLFNYNVDPETHWDIALIATHDDLAVICEENTDVEYITLVTGEYSFKKLDPKTGAEIQ